LNRHLGNNIAENLIPEFERVVGETQPKWFLMENVAAAPTPTVADYSIEDFILNNRWLPDDNGIGHEQNRIRKFVFGTKGNSRSDFSLKMFIEMAALENPVFAPTVLTGKGNGGYKEIEINGAIKKCPNYGKRREFSEMARLQGLPENFLDDAPFTSEGKRRVVGNGVPLPMGKAIAKAIKKFLNNE
jgi:DNA (cytosine-5)-methyltransferase 1